jgi:UDP-glucose 4-epimerase
MDDGTRGGRWRGRRVLVTGGLGFIGSSLAHALVAAGADVTLADAMLPEFGGNPFNVADLRGRVTINYCDVRDEHLMALMTEGMDVVFHLAAQVSHVKSLSDPYPDIDINIKGTAAVLEAVRKSAPRALVVRTGTRGQYGAATRLPVAEDAPTHPKGLHEISHLTAEKIFQMYHDVHGIPVVMLRLTNIYGPRAQMKSSHFGVANWLMRLALDGKPITLFGDGLIQRDFVYVDDCVDAMLRCAETPACDGQVINVGDDRPATFRDLAAAIVAEQPDAQVVFTEFTPERRAQEPGNFYSDIARIRSLTGWEPTTTLREGVSRTLAFYRRHREHYW